MRVRRGSAVAPRGWPEGEPRSPKAGLPAKGVTRMRVGSAFAGIGGFDLAFERAGASVAWQIEIDPTCVRVLERHWPGVLRHDDIRTSTGADLPPVDVITGGFPCQDLSVAGKRAGLSGSRSGLFFDLCDLIAALRPAWIVLENVPGLLSSHGGRDMGTVLGALGELGYSVAYRVLDAQFYGVPQRRKRVFIVGHSGEDWRPPAAVLFDSASCRWDLAPRTEAWSTAASLVASGAGAGRTGGNELGFLVAGTPAGGATRPEGAREMIVRSLTSDTRLDPTSETLVFQCHGSNVGPAGALRQGRGTVSDGVPFVAATLNSGGNSGGFRFEPGEHLVPHLIDTTGHQGDRVVPSSGVWTTLPHSGANNGGGAGALLLHEMAVRRLTPRECERLQGFPDDWTAYGSDGKPIADSSRYRMLGNAVAVPVVEWIARRLMAVDAMLRGKAGTNHAA
ncbi:MAG: cytosine methyltransferase [Bacillota bacterium]|nr:MAG: cytosine methyltransferase [Bacillota bacterium]